MNLLLDPWLPAIRQHSGSCKIAPATLTEDLRNDPVIDIAWPRPDFRIATLEFLTGLLSTACPPADHDAWLDLWHAPPGPAALAAAFAPLAHAFDMDGDGPRFLQDFDDLAADAEPIERLLIESPGASTIAKNTDLLVRRGRVGALGREAAAMALYTFQSWAPAGGAGNRVGLRGGGPMVTMVRPTRHPALWHQVWANVRCGEPPKAADLPLVFPWLAPTVTSKDDRPVTPDAAHPLQCWWGMPRRIRLDFQALAEPRPCGLTGAADTVAVASWRQRPHGSKYVAWGGIHPLTPTYQLKPETEKLALHPQPGGVGYRHWLGLVLADATGLRAPAKSVADWRERFRDADEGARLLAAGYDMDNMKARGFVETEMPLPAARDKDAQARTDALARILVRAAEQVASLLRSAVRSALFSAGATVKLDVELLSSVRERLWSATEAAFFEALENAAGAAAGPEGDAEAYWQRLLRNTALALFDEAAPMDPDVPPMVRAGEAAPRLVRARRNLVFALQGFGKDGEALFTTLNLAKAQPNAARKRKVA